MPMPPPRLLEAFHAATSPLPVDILESTGNGRRLTARLLTFGEETRDWRKMAFVAGAVTLDDDIPVAYAHQTGGGFLSGSPVVVGKVLKVWEDAVAVYAEMEISTTPDAEEVWTLISDGSLTKVSIGGKIVEYQFNEDTEELTVLAFDLAEISIVPVPAMKSAQIVSNQPGELVTLAPTHTQEAGTMPEQETTPVETSIATTAPAAPQAPDTTVHDRLETIEDLMRLRAATVPPTVTGTARPGQFRSLGELFGAVAAMDLGADSDARDSLAHGLENGNVYFAPNGRRMIDVFAFEIGSTTEATGDAGQVNDLLKLLRDGRVMAAHFATGDLDTVPGKSVDAPTVSQAALVNYQTEAGAVASNRQEWLEDSYPKATLAGGQTVTVQARDWSRPSYMAEVLEDLAAAYGEKVNEEVVNGVGTVGPPQKVRGILVAQTARIDATASAAAVETVAGELVKSIGLAKAAAHTATKRWPSKIFISGTTLGTIEGFVDADGRPLLSTDGPSNAIGTLEGPSPAGRIRGLTVYADDAIPAGLAVLATFRDAKLWESAGAPVQVGLTYPDSLTIDVALFGYFAVAIRRPGAFSVIHNIGVTGL